jgi:hypothetical protein
VISHSRSRICCGPGMRPGLQGREAHFDLSLLTEVFEGCELCVQGGCGEFLLAADGRFFAADALLEPADRAGQLSSEAGSSTRRLRGRDLDAGQTSRECS